MIEAVLFNWSGTLSDYGGRGREAWYQAAGGEATSPARLAAHWPKHAGTISTLKPGVLLLLNFLQCNQIPYGTLTLESAPVLADLVQALHEFNLKPQINLVDTSPIHAIHQAVSQLAIHNQAHVLGVFDQGDWLIAAKHCQLNTVGIIEGSRMIGLSQPAWTNLPAGQKKRLAQLARRRLIQLEVENPLMNAQALFLLIRQLKQLEVRA
ncbi:hypothetical protein [Lacticaseibacillus manihotivorans]|jgi:hypothetical protein|uniref:Uncharacterized protein n=2 Tax=Lacticaseibacillus manihotivorans TaxID=88233 RepID=A0A0R1PVR8_9LACO|nr:hypothetical protein [Lacticaseibacillus manihotivorans]KRL36704.1 hypothetical protein FD01_GL002934 [Lacticaseibacillus manihotivorans DSM 13343 = JCM 12514]QFQ91710.1 hypothetical protein LM010_09840 [Lacticaseibacillus manihotivorans]